MLPANRGTDRALTKKIRANEHMTKESTGARGDKPKRNGPEHLLGANSEIARKLNEYYKSLLSDEVPDHLTQLLLQLEQAETERKRG